MQEKEIQQFISNAHTLARAAKAGEIAMTEMKKAQQAMYQLSSKHQTALQRIKTLEDQNKALNARCNELTDKLRAIVPITVVNSLAEAVPAECNTQEPVAAD